jgi:CP family cyanate transporter-like MFS transporter
VASLVLVAFNLRPVLASLGPVLPDVMRDIDLSAAGASLLTTVPVLCLGLFAPLAPPLSRRFGMDRAMLFPLLAVTLGTAMRGLANGPALLVGSLLAGAGIGIANVLLPGIVKRDFPNRVAPMTGLYTMAFGAGVVAASGATAPLQAAFQGSWAAALAFWAIPATAATAVWAFRVPSRHKGTKDPAFAVRGLWADPLAWQVTLFMGLQASLAYSVFGWLAPILIDRGLPAVTAGLVVSFSALTQLVASLVAPSLANRRRDQRVPVLLCVAINLAGLMGCLFAPLSAIWISSAILGIGQGAIFAVALLLMMLRAPNANVATQLSGMAQSVGYALAAGGPLMVGLLRDWTGDWAAVGILFLGIGLAAAICGTGAGRARYVGATGTSLPLIEEETSSSTGRQ